MSIEALAAAFIAPFETPDGKRILAAYPDIAGVWTVGYGTTCFDGETVEEGLVLTP